MSIHLFAYRPRQIWRGGGWRKNAGDLSQSDTSIRAGSHLPGDSLASTPQSGARLHKHTSSTSQQTRQRAKKVSPGSSMRSLFEPPRTCPALARARDLTWLSPGRRTGCRTCGRYGDKPTRPATKMTLKTWDTGGAGGPSEDARRRLIVSGLGVLSLHVCQRATHQRV